MSLLLSRPLLTVWRHPISRQHRLSTALTMSSPAAPSPALTSASTSTPSTSSSSPAQLPHVPECPRFTTVAVGDRLYRQQIIPPPGGHTPAFHSTAASTSPTQAAAASRPTGMPPPRSAPSRVQPLDESLLPLVEETRVEAGGVLYRLVVDCESACMLSSMSTQQQRAVEDIQHSHRTNIQLPTKAPHSHTIVVTGADRDSVVYSKQAIDRLLTSLMADCPYTHFLSLPLPSFHSSVNTLRDTILASFPTAVGLDPSIFVRPTSLHFTVLMLTLPTAHYVQRAAAALTSMAVPMMDEEFSVRLRGLGLMNERADAAHVLYIQPDESSQQRLTQLAAALIEAMRQAGVLSDSEVRKQRLLERDRATGEDTVNVKWHATIINTKHRRGRGAGGGGGGGGGAARDTDHSSSPAASQTKVAGGRGGGRKSSGWGKRRSVDVSGVLAEYGDLDWGEGSIKTCELSRLSWDSHTNFYPCEAKLLL